MGPTWPLVLRCVALGLAMVAASQASGWLARRWSAPEESGELVAGPVVGAIFALLGLLVAFSFYGAQGRLDTRRQLIVDEANAIGTAWLRLDVAPEASRPALREELRRYAESRAALFVALTDAEAAWAEVHRASAVQATLWADAVAATSAPEAQPGRVVLLPALNAMFDLAATRTVAIQTHPPPAVYALLYFLAITCAALIGLRAPRARRALAFHGAVFALVTSLTLYLTLDIEYPRSGLVDLESVNQVLVDLAASLN